MLGDTIQVPELEWHAQAIPHYGYMLDDSQKGAMLAGGHCIPIMLPRTERMIWHKLYASTQRTGAPDKAEKDIVQAVTLAAVLVDQDGASLSDSFRDAPTALQSAALSRLPRITPPEIIRDLTPFARAKKCMISQRSARAETVLAETADRCSRHGQFVVDVIIASPRLPSV
jgi:hypothetical protein